MVLSYLFRSSHHSHVHSRWAVLQSIYGDRAISPWRPSSSVERAIPLPESHIVRYQVSLRYEFAASSVRFVIKCSFPPPHDAISLEVLVSLPQSYPATSPPQLQLLSRYVGAFGVDAELFGSIIKTFMSVNGIEWTPGVICVFDGLESVLERAVHWYERRIESMKASEALREQNLDSVRPEACKSATVIPPVSASIQPVSLPEGIELFEAEPIIDRKSAFVGRACRISDPAQVITRDKTCLVVERA